MKIKNIEMEHMLKTLEPILKYRNKIAYVAARNTRLLNTELIEYFKIKNSLIEKYGEQEIDENGKTTNKFALKINSQNFDSFCKEFDEIANIEHDVKLMTLPYDETVGILSGEEILNIEWMLTDGSDN